MKTNDLSTPDGILDEINKMAKDLGTFLGSDDPPRVSVG